MSDIVDFLEKLGRDTSAHDAAPEEIDRRLAEVGVEPTVRAALVAGDKEEFERLLGARSNVCCLIDPAVQDEEDDDAETKRECDDDAIEEQPVPVRDPEKIASAA